MEALKILAFTHHHLDVNKVGLLHVNEDLYPEKLSSLKNRFSFSELMYLSTCNRVELILATDLLVDQKLIADIVLFLQPSLSNAECDELVEGAQCFENQDALRHLFSVASSMDSLVVGEREIISQVRRAYENCKKLNLTSDRIRIAVQQTIVTAKEIYTQTGIARHPVSVVSLAYRKLKQLNIPKDARFLVIGAGETNTNMAKYLQKQSFRHFAVFNRTLSKAQELAAVLGGVGFPLDELCDYRDGFDVIITCTAAANPVITSDIYRNLLNGDTSKKVVIDLAIPNDLSEEILQSFDVNLIAISNLRDIAAENMNQRKQELDKCSSIIESRVLETQSIFKERQIELAFSDIPQKVKAIRETAVNEVFAGDLQKLDPYSREVVDNLLLYMEKKYNAVAMKTAKDALLEA